MLSCALPQGRYRSLTGRLLAREAWLDWRLETKGERPERALCPEYKYLGNGKPEFAEAEGFYFNISHSGSYAVCAASDREVGADIQLAEQERPGVARRFFTKREQELLEQSAGAKRSRLFYRLWSAKEAYVKYTGRGLSGGLDHFHADLETGRIVDETGETAASLWEGELSGEGGEYVLSVCFDGAGEVIRRNLDGFTGIS